MTSACLKAIFRDFSNKKQEWLISAPKHVALYQAFGWQPPIFAHLGLLVNPDGTKLSKRNDDVNLSAYKTGRVFPAPLLSWLANLGSSFKANVTPPRSVADIAEAVRFLSLLLLHGYKLLTFLPPTVDV